MVMLPVAACLALAGIWGIALAAAIILLRIGFLRGVRQGKWGMFAMVFPLVALVAEFLRPYYEPGEDSLPRNWLFSTLGFS